MAQEPPLFRSERDWCEKAGVSDSYIGALRTKHRQGTAKTAKLDVVEKLADAAGVSVGWLMGAEEMPLRGPSGSRERPSRPSLGEAVAVSAQVRQALESYDWPSGTATSLVAEISDALAKEAFAHRGSFIPPSHWTNRIQEELAARKGKRIAHVVTDDPVEERKRARKTPRS